MGEFESDYTGKAFKYFVDKNHRMILVMIGRDTKKHIPALHSRLCKISALQSVIWCYKNAETAEDAVAKKQRVADEDDPLARWVKTVNPDHILYKEGNRILGRTCDMLVLQDFEAVTPNTTVTCMETVRGGGLIVLLLDQASTLSQLLAYESDMHEAMGIVTEARFNRRFFRSLIMSEHALFLDSKMRVMDITKRLSFDDLAKSSRSQEKEENGRIILDQHDAPISDLLRLCRTEDQKKVLDSCIQVITKGEDAAVSITAARGRGKSASLGLLLSYAITAGMQVILVSALYLENVQTVFEFAVSGLQACGNKKGTDFKVHYNFVGKKRAIFKIEIVKTKQCIKYFHPFEKLSMYPSLLVIDEAASIPIESMQALLEARLVFLASTIGGYEGTGRAFSTKLVEYLKTGNLGDSQIGKSRAAAIRPYVALELGEPIRYARNDPVERWLGVTLLFDAVPAPLGECPPLSSCSLYYINKAVLFAGAEETEHVLRELFSVFAASHYRNSPNDLQILADAISHEVFVLLSPCNRILCAVQAAFEGAIDKASIRKEGNLIPWVLQETFYDDCFLENLGVRIVRIAVHPSAQAMGYGTEALRRMIAMFSAASRECEVPGEGGHRSIIPNNPSVLFSLPESIKIAKTNWIGASFSLNEKILNFWKKNGFVPLCIKQSKSKTTGAHAALVMRDIGGKTSDGPEHAPGDIATKIASMNRIFIQRLIPLIGYSFRTFSPSLCLALIHSAPRLSAFQQVTFTGDEKHRLTLFAKGIVGVRSALDAVPKLAHSYFYSANIARLTVLHQSALLMIGLQYYEPHDVCRTLGIEDFQLNAILAKVAKLIIDEAQ